MGRSRLFYRRWSMRELLGVWVWVWVGLCIIGSCWVYDHGSKFAPLPTVGGVRFWSMEGVFSYWVGHIPWPLSFEVYDGWGRRFFVSSFPGVGFQSWSVCDGWGRGVWSFPSCCLVGSSGVGPMHINLYSLWHSFKRISCVYIHIHL